MRRVTIDPLTRLEGHGRVELFLDDAGALAAAYLVIPELRGFEQLCLGRPLEEMPGLTSRICGLCPEAHHLASTRALDVLYGVEPPPPARLIRELFYVAFVLSNHATHFFALAGPDLMLAADAPRAERNLGGVLRQIGPELGRRVLAHRVHNHEVIEMLGGRRIQPVGGVPGGWLRVVDEAMRERILDVARENVDFALACLELYHDLVLSSPARRELLNSLIYTQPLHSLGTVDDHGRLSLLEGVLRVVDPAGGEKLRFEPARYRDHIGERAEPWTNVKLTYLTAPGWDGLRAGDGSGVYAVGPLARLNCCDGLSTPLAQQAFEDLFDSFSRRRGDGRYEPIHNRLLTHAARLVEQLWAAERMLEIASDPELTHPDVRRPVPACPVVREAVGCVEAPRGTLIHDYTADDDGFVTSCNLIVATTNNHAAIALAITDAARRLFGRGAELTDRVLDRIEMAIRAHDPCFACATHSFPGDMPLRVVVRDRLGRRVASFSRQPESRS